MSKVIIGYDPSEVQPLDLRPIGKELPTIIAEHLKEMGGTATAKKKVEVHIQPYSRSAGYDYPINALPITIDVYAAESLERRYNLALSTALIMRDLKSAVLNDQKTIGNRKLKIRVWLMPVAVEVS